MKLPTRQNKKRDQALDAFASVAKTWSEWRLGERATKTVAKGTKKATKSAAKARKKAYRATRGSDASALTRAVNGTPLKIAGAVALVAGVGAAVAKKLKGGGTAEPLYTPPPAPAPMKPPAELKDVPPPPKTSVVVGDLDSADKGSDDKEPEPAAVDATPDAADSTAADADADSVAASERAAAAAAEPATDATEPTVPDTEPEDAEDNDVRDAKAHTAQDAAVTAGTDPEGHESAPAGDAACDDAPTIPAADEPTDKS